MARTKIFVPRETAAISVGADDVAIAIARYAKEAGHDIQLVRNGSWGATWLEPLIEVQVDVSVSPMATSKRPMSKDCSPPVCSKAVTTRSASGRSMRFLTWSARTAGRSGAAD